jgi:hypothetical protein
MPSHKAKVDVVVRVVQHEQLREEVATEFYARTAKLHLDGWEWQDALIEVGKDFGLFRSPRENGNG